MQVMDPPLGVTHFAGMNCFSLRLLMEQRFELAVTRHPVQLQLNVHEFRGRRSVDETPLKLHRLLGCSRGSQA